MADTLYHATLDAAEIGLLLDLLFVERLAHGDTQYEVIPDGPVATVEGLIRKLSAIRTAHLDAG